MSCCSATLRRRRSMTSAADEEISRPLINPCESLDFKNPIKRMGCCSATIQRRSSMTSASDEEISRPLINPYESLDFNDPINCSATLWRFFFPISPTEGDDSPRNRELKTIVESYKDTIIPAIDSDLANVQSWLQDLRLGVCCIITDIFLYGAKKTIDGIKEKLFPPVFPSGALEETMRQLRLQMDRISEWHRHSKSKEGEEEKMVKMIKEAQRVTGSELDGIRWQLKMLTVAIMRLCLQLTELIKEGEGGGGGGGGEEEVYAVKREMDRCVEEFTKNFNIYCKQFFSLYVDLSRDFSKFRFMFLF